MHPDISLGRLTFLIPIATYHAALQALENTTANIDEQVWFIRLGCFAVTITTWIVLLAPILVWKYLVRILPVSVSACLSNGMAAQGKVRVMRLADQWTRTDALSAPSYGAAPVWRASLPGFFRDTIVRTNSAPEYSPPTNRSILFPQVLMVTVPLTKKSHFDHDSYLPPVRTLSPSFVLWHDELMHLDTSVRFRRGRRTAFLREFKDDPVVARSQRRDEIWRPPDLHSVIV